MMQLRGVVIPSLDLNPGMHFQFFDDPRSGLSKKQIRNNCRGVIILALDPDLELVFLPFGD